MAQAQQTTPGKPARKSKTKPTASALKKPERATKPIPAALANFDQLPDSAHVRLPVVAGLRGIHEKTVWRHVKRGLLPKPDKLGPNTTGWNVGKLRRHAAGGAADA